MGVLTAAAKAAKAARTAARTASMKAASKAKQLAKEAALAKKKAAEAKAKIKANQTNLGGKTSTRGKPKDTPAKAEADRKRASTRIKDNKNKAAAKTVEKKGSVAKKMTVSKTDIREAETAIAIQNYIRKINAMKDGLIKTSLLTMAKAKLKALRKSQSSDKDFIERKMSQGSRDATKNTKANVSLPPMMDFNKGGMPMAQGDMPMTMKNGKKVPAFAADGVGKMMKGGMAKKKPAAKKMMAGGMAKPKAKSSGYMYGGMAKKPKAKK